MASALITQVANPDEENEGEVLQLMSHTTLTDNLLTAVHNFLHTNKKQVFLLDNQFSPADWGIIGTVALGEVLRRMRRTVSA